MEAGGVEPPSEKALQLEDHMLLSRSKGFRRQNSEQTKTRYPASPIDLVATLRRAKRNDQPTV